MSISRQRAEFDPTAFRLKCHHREFTLLRRDQPPEICMEINYRRAGQRNSSRETSNYFSVRRARSRGIMAEACLLISNCREGGSRISAFSLFFSSQRRGKSVGESSGFPRQPPSLSFLRVLFPQRLNAENRTEPVSWNNGDWLPGGGTRGARSRQTENGGNDGKMERRHCVADRRSDYGKRKRDTQRERLKGGESPASCH